MSATGDALSGILRPQYADVVRALSPILYNLPPKIIAIDGWPGVGKTTLGRFLSWRFNVALLETDLFLILGQGKLVYLDDEIVRIIDRRIKNYSEDGRPIIVDGLAILRLLSKLQREPDFMVYVSNTLVEEAGNLAREVTAYDREFRPKERADLCITVEE